MGKLVSKLKTAMKGECFDYVEVSKGVFEGVRYSKVFENIAVVDFFSVCQRLYERSNMRTETRRNYVEN